MAAKKVCSIEGCEASAERKDGGKLGLCQRDYMKAYRQRAEETKDGGKYYGTGEGEGDEKAPAPGGTGTGEGDAPDNPTPGTGGTGDDTQGEGEGTQGEGTQGEGEGEGEGQQQGEGEEGEGEEGEQAPPEMPPMPPPPPVESKEQKDDMDKAWEVMGRSINRETEQEEREKWMPVYEQCRKTIADLAKAAAAGAKQVEYKPENFPGFDVDFDNLGATHCVFGDVLDEFALLENVVLIGPAGSGKTSAAVKAANALGLAYYSHGAVYSKHELLGYLDARGERAITALYRWATNPEGGVLNIDEMDSSLPKALTPLHELLDNRRVEFPGGVVVELTERHLVVASMNTFGRGASRLYIGRNALDAATIDRFVQIECGYDSDYEKAIFGYAHEDKWTNRRRAWIDEVQLTREAVDNLRKEHVVSMRASRRGVRAIEAGQKLSAPRKRRYLFSGLDDGQVSQIRKEMRDIEAKREAAAAPTTEEEA